MIDDGVIAVVVNVDGDAATARIAAASCVKEQLGNTPEELLTFTDDASKQEIPPRLSVTDVTDAPILHFQVSNVLGVTDGKTFTT